MHLIPPYLDPLYSAIWEEHEIHKQKWLSYQRPLKFTKHILSLSQVSSLKFHASAENYHRIIKLNYEEADER